eukprot:scaffold260353_cov22-Attheya_sp.AAC.1
MIYTVPTPKWSQPKTNVITQEAFQAIALATIGAPITNFPFTTAISVPQPSPTKNITIAQV